MLILGTKEKLSESMNGNEIERAKTKIEAFLCGQIAKRIRYVIEHDGQTSYLKGEIIIDKEIR